VAGYELPGEGEKGEREKEKEKKIESCMQVAVILV
jgi:hypothetical protein